MKKVGKTNQKNLKSREIIGELDAECGSRDLNPSCSLGKAAS